MLVSELQTEKQQTLGNRNGKKNNCADISSEKMTGLHMKRHRKMLRRDYLKRENEQQHKTTSQETIIFKRKSIIRKIIGSLREAEKEMKQLIIY